MTLRHAIECLVVLGASVGLAAMTYDAIKMLQASNPPPLIIAVLPICGAWMALVWATVFLIRKKVISSSTPSEQRL